MNDKLLLWAVYVTLGSVGMFAIGAAVNLLTRLTLLFIR
jgi:hypothetical protein